MPPKRPWTRLYVSWRTDPRVQGESEFIRAAAINLLCLAEESTHPGYIEASPGKPFSPFALGKALNIPTKSVAKFLKIMEDREIFGLKITDSGTIVLEKWLESHPQDPSAQERINRYRSNLYNRNSTVTPSLQQRNSTVTVTGESRVEGEGRGVGTLPPDPSPHPVTSPPQEKKEEKKGLTNVSPKKSAFGEFLNVLLTADEYEKLSTRFGPELKAKIENLSAGIASKGYKYKSHYATILNWERLHAERPPNGNGGMHAHSKPAYTGLRFNEATGENEAT